MKVRRLASFALMAVATAGGCAASRVGQLPPPGPMAARAPESPAISEVVYRHNRNAALVQSVEAQPSVSLKSRISAGTTASMVFERPHNFRFVVKKGSLSAATVADLGSNDDEFWFWANDKEDHNVYVARYDAPPNPGSSELAFQPEWIVEALGLREIPEDEQRQIRVADGPQPGTVSWTHGRTTLRGEPIRKVTILDARTGQVLQHHFYAPNAKKPVAVAQPIGMKAFATAEEPGRTVRMPQRIHLTLATSEPKGSPVEMDLVLNDLKINAPIAEERRREGLFAVPEIAGSQVVRVDQAPRRASGEADETQGTRPRTRQSLPAPPAGSGVELGPPAPIGADEAYLKRSDPLPLEPDLGRDSEEALGAVVGSPVPRAPEAPAARFARRGAVPYEQ